MPKQKTVRSRLFSALSPVCIGLLLAGAGCGSLSESNSSSFASVDIPNKSVEQITAATLQVFGAKGYRGGVTAPARLVFEKEASRGTSFAREGVVAGYYGATTINRVRAEITPLANSTFRLSCKAYMVTGGSDPFFQDEVPLANIRSGPYQSMLNKVANDLK